MHPRFKYRFAYVVHNACVLRANNETGKGDHRHYGEKERPYVFSDPDTLIADFQANIARWNHETVILDVRSPSDAMTDFSQVWKSRNAQRSARISFATPELLWQVLTVKRWELLKALCGAGPVSIREAARHVHRHVRAVHSDITALVSADILIRAQHGGVTFPFDAVKVELPLQAA